MKIRMAAVPVTEMAAVIKMAIICAHAMTDERW
jgi:hypothetical protein